MSICERCSQKMSCRDLEFDWLGEIIVPAIDSFYEDSTDRDLIERNVSERAIVTIIFLKMNQLLKEKQLSNTALQGLNIDVEYNKNFDEAKIAYKEKCEQCEKNDCKAKEYVLERDKAKKMIPDIIIHKRESNHDNKVVIEFKKACNKKIKNDIAKLKYFTCQKGFNNDEQRNYKYQIGFFIILNKNCSRRIDCYKDGKKIKSQ